MCGIEEAIYWDVAKMVLAIREVVPADVTVILLADSLQVIAARRSCRDEERIAPVNGPSPHAIRRHAHGNVAIQRAAEALDVQWFPASRRNKRSERCAGDTR